MIDLYACGSPNVFKVIAMLAETELAYCLHEVDMYSEQHGVNQLPVGNWNGKIPIIMDRGGFDGRPHTVVESGAILIYLGEKTSRLIPFDQVPAARLCSR
jgi:GSH-dependent disulfide-bond oxidoreductase